MRKASAFASLLFLLGVFALVSQPRAQLTLTGVGEGGIGGAAGPACATYTGPGDIAGTGSPLAWWGQRAFKASLCGNALHNLCNTNTSGTDLACADILSSTSDGSAVPQTLSGTFCPSLSALVCTVKTLYDQTVGGNCSGSCDMIGASALSRLTAYKNDTGCLNTSGTCFSTQTAASGNPTSAGIPLQTAGNLSLAQPFSIVATGNLNSIGNPTNFSILAQVGNMIIAIPGNGTNNTFQFYCDGASAVNFNQIETTNTWYSIALTCATASGGSGQSYFNGGTAGSNTGMGTTTQNAQPKMLWPNTATNNVMYMTELGIYSGTLSPTVISNISASQRLFYGY